MNDTRKVWVISCACGWSRMVPREMPTEDRRALLTGHQRSTHGEEPQDESDA